MAAKHSEMQRLQKSVLCFLLQITNSRNFVSIDLETGSARSAASYLIIFPEFSPFAGNLVFSPCSRCSCSFYIFLHAPNFKHVPPKLQSSVSIVIASPISTPRSYSEFGRTALVTLGYSSNHERTIPLQTRRHAHGHCFFMKSVGIL